METPLSPELKQNSDAVWEAVCVELLGPVEEEIARLAKEMDEVNKRINNPSVSRSTTYNADSDRLVDLGRQQSESFALRQYLEELLEAIERGDSGSIETAIELLSSKFSTETYEETDCVSNRKSGVQKEAQRLIDLGIDPYNYSPDLWNTSNPTHLSTGRHATRIVGSFDPFVAVTRYFDQTADTHGGKVKPGHNSSGRVTGEDGRVKRLGGTVTTRDISLRAAQREFPGRQLR